MTSRERLITMFKRGAELDKYDVSRELNCSTRHALALLSEVRDAQELFIVGWTRTGNLLTPKWSLTKPPRPVAKPRKLTGSQRTKQYRARRRKLKKSLGWTPPAAPWAALWEVVVQARHPRFPRAPQVSHQLIDDE